MKRDQVRMDWHLTPDGVARSREWLEIPGARIPEDPGVLLRELDLVYYRWIARLTAGTVRVVHGALGAQAEVQPLGWPVGLVLGPPVIRDTGIFRAILGGWLVAEASGELGVRLESIPGGVSAAVVLEEFRPMLPRLGLPGRWLYTRGQIVIHARLSRGYLLQEVVPRVC